MLFTAVVQTITHYKMLSSAVVQTLAHLAIQYTCSKNVYMYVFSCYTYMLTYFLAIIQENYLLPSVIYKHE
jgi:hypothetical protein